MNRFLIVAMLGAACLPAFAQQPSIDAPAQPQTASLDRPSPAQDAITAERPLDDYRCLRHTGSLITASRNQRVHSRKLGKAPNARCAPVAGRAWTRDDLDRTGATNVLDALRMLDPSVH